MSRFNAEQSTRADDRAFGSPKEFCILSVLWGEGGESSPLRENKRSPRAVAHFLSSLFCPVSQNKPLSTPADWQK
ncbi:hypothetical protein TNIN_263121 [Trichonephila inaurata madagascariensis]|uniref:Uncharacterized protein n=1 Tax=Trichonephila inaurata madagascariensis TaxID=2747483 RepID=A0A8X6KFW5_9ARAC|nr:hypothetical protein TNIN_263121 [Trichonephila inaurata madagascariensis]